MLLTAAAGLAQAPGPFPAAPASGPRPLTLPAAQNPRPRPQAVAADAPAAVLPTPPQAKVIVFEKNAGSDAPTPMGAGAPLPVLAIPQVPDAPAPDKKDAKGTPPKADPNPSKNPDLEATKPSVQPAEETPCLPTRKPFKLEAERELIRRVTQELIEEERARELRDKKKTEWQPNLEYYRTPPEARLVGCEGPHVPKTAAYPPYTKHIEPGYVVHRRLHFEQPNSERHGWELGFAQPAISTLAFYKDVLLWPASLASNLRERYDTSAGKCPPGSPFPYSIYPPGYSLFGLGAEASILVGAAFALP